VKQGSHLPGRVVGTLRRIEQRVGGRNAQHRGTTRVEARIAGKREAIEKIRADLPCRVASASVAASK
jgi:hypothetical protein